MSKSTPAQQAVPLKENMLKNSKIVSDRYYLLQHLPKKGKGIEIGVLGGDWSKYLLDITDPEELILIDTFCSNDYAHLNRFTKKTHEAYINGKFEAFGDKVKIKKGLSWDVLLTLPEKQFDWIYIDAGHDYNSVKKDLDLSLPLLKENGYIIMNDYIMYDHITNENYGVVQATNEFMHAHNFEMLFLAFHPGMFCDVMIKKM